MATAVIRPLACEPPHEVGTALKKKKNLLHVIVAAGKPEIFKVGQQDEISCKS